MSPSAGFIRRHSLVIGVVLMFALTWSIDLGNAGLLPWRVPFPASIFAGWGVLIAAVAMTLLTLGWPATRILLGRYFRARVGWQWYLALLIVPAISGLGVMVYAALTHTRPDFASTLVDQLKPSGISRLGFVIPFFLVDLISNGEEAGWRGYVLPRLQSRYSALGAALLVGIIWAIWHVPLFLTHWSWPYMLLFTLDCAAKSIVLAWLYNSTGGSLLLVAMAHSAWNTAGIYLPIANTLTAANLGAFGMVVLLEIGLAVVVTLGAGSANLSRTLPKQVQA